MIAFRWASWRHDLLVSAFLALFFVAMPILSHWVQMDQERADAAERKIVEERESKLIVFSGRHFKK
jgi:hypothetical protein